MTGDNTKKSPKGSDEGFERSKLAGKPGSETPDASLKPDANAKEQAEASAKLSEDANKNPQQAEQAPIKALVAMQGKLDTSVEGETQTKPITRDDMYEHMFKGGQEDKTHFKIGAQVWDEWTAEKQDKKVPDKTEKASVNADVKVAAEVKAVEPINSSKDATIISDVSNAHVPLNTTSKVVLKLSASETVVKKANLPEAVLPKVAIAKDNKVDVKKDVPLTAELDLAKNLASGSGKAIDQSGKTIGYWCDHGKKLVMSISMETTAKTENAPDSTSKTKPAAKPSSLSFAPSGSALDTKANTHLEKFTQPVHLPSNEVAAYAAPSVAPSADTTVRPNIDVPNSPTAVAQSAEKVIQTRDVVAQSKVSIANAETSAAVESIKKAIEPVQDHVDNNHPLGTALAQKASAVQRDLQDVVSNQGAKQEKALASLEASVKVYNTLIESNTTTAAMADKLKIAMADVNTLKTAIHEGLLEGAKPGDSQPSKLATSIAGLSALRDPAHAILSKTIALIEQFKYQNLVSSFQRAMILGLTSNRDLSSVSNHDIPTATLNRVIAESSAAPSSRMDFAPDRNTIVVSQESRAGATPINASEANAQAITTDGQTVRLDNAVNPVFGALAFHAGNAQSDEVLARHVAEHAENQRLHLDLFDWMKGQGFRALLSPGTPPPAESTSKPVIAFVPRIRGVGPGDARIVAPTFKPLPTLGDRHTLTGQLQGLPAVLGAFNADRRVQYNQLMQLLQTAEDKALAKGTRTQGAVVASQPDNLLRRYPFLGPDNQRRQSALYAKPDSGVDFGANQSGSVATTATPVLASAATQEPPAGQASAASNQDEET